MSRSFLSTAELRREVVIASAVLSEADRAEFEEKLQEYPGFG